MGCGPGKLSTLGGGVAPPSKALICINKPTRISRRISNINSKHRSRSLVVEIVAVRETMTHWANSYAGEKK